MPRRGGRLEAGRRSGLRALTIVITSKNWEENHAAPEAPRLSGNSGFNLPGGNGLRYAKASHQLRSARRGHSHAAGKDGGSSLRESHIALLRDPVIQRFPIDENSAI